MSKAVTAPASRRADSRGLVIPLRPRREVDPVATSVAERSVYSVAEVAELLGLGTGTVYAMLRAGEIPARRAGDRWIISRRRLHTWLDEAETTTPGGAR